MLQVRDPAATTAVTQRAPLGTDTEQERESARPGLPALAMAGATAHAGRMTLWFIVWLIADNVGGREPLRTAPVNVWAATLILAVALDLGSSHARQGRRRR